MKRLLLSVCLCLTACGGVDKASINAVLDARDTAISGREIGSYSDLVATRYHSNGKGKIDVVAQMIHLFDQFDAVEMRSFDREIRVVDDNHAQCAQSYRLRVHTGDRWREMVQREELSLTRTPAGWKISAGL